jgi:hypothetical protein
MSGEGILPNDRRADRADPFDGDRRDYRPGDHVSWSAPDVDRAPLINPSEVRSDD